MTPCTCWCWCAAARETFDRRQNASPDKLGLQSSIMVVVVTPFAITATLMNSTSATWGANGIKCRKQKTEKKKRKRCAANNPRLHRFLSPYEEYRQQTTKKRFFLHALRMTKVQELLKIYNVYAYSRELPRLLGTASLRINS